MNYIKAAFQHVSHLNYDLLIARLSILDLNGMEELEKEVNVYFDKNKFPNSVLNEIATELQLDLRIVEVEEVNWNEKWEENFRPLVIDGFCSVRAHFHPRPPDLPLDIIITPKMSFGTGHHATTELMITIMRKLDFNEKKVLDFGTGTGILAILAKKLGAAKTLAIDNDKWSIENAEENFRFNSIDDIELTSLPIAELKHEAFDIILANINRSVLLENMSHFQTIVKRNAYLLLSGILDIDVERIQLSAETNRFQLVELQSKNGWSALLFKIKA